MSVVTRERKSLLVGQKIDSLFREMGIDPNLASLSAFQAEIFLAQEFPARMVRHRIERGISRTALADLVGYDKDTLTRWETGKCSPKLRDMANWAEVLGFGLNLTLYRVQGQQGERQA